METPSKNNYCKVHLLIIQAILKESVKRLQDYPLLYKTFFKCKINFIEPNVNFLGEKLLIILQKIEKILFISPT